MDRRDFLVGAGVAAGSTVLPTPPASGSDWHSVRREFRLDPTLVNLALHYLATNPREVREEIDRVRRRLDANPYDFPPDLWDRPTEALANYVGGATDDIIAAPNTTCGLGMLYQGMKLRADQEILVNDQDHAWHQQAARLAAERSGARLRIGTLFTSSATATEDEIATRLRAAITPQTRSVSVTWVQSSTGVRMPVRTAASVVADANRGRAEEDRCLLIVNGVHGLAAVDDDAARMGADAFVAGTHKWLFGPRGTGMVWIKPDARQHFRDVLPAGASGPGGFHAFEHQYAVHAAVAFHQRIGRARVAARITELNTRFKDGLAAMKGVTIHTPHDPAMSAGFVCFDVDGVASHRVVAHLASQQIQITTAPYRIPYARVATTILNTPREIDRTLRAIASVPR